MLRISLKKTKPDHKPLDQKTPVESRGYAVNSSCHVEQGNITVEKTERKPKQEIKH
jgi:hypothetical protein